MINNFTEKGFPIITANGDKIIASFRIIVVLQSYRLAMMKLLIIQY